MPRYTCWLAGIILAIGSLSASGEIQVPAGFVVDTLLDQIDGRTPRLEAIRNADYGFGVVAASVDNGILTVLRIAQGDVAPIGSQGGFADGEQVATIRFDHTGLYGGSLYLTVVDPRQPEFGHTHFLRVDPLGTVEEMVTLGDSSNNLNFVFDFTDGLGGYLAGAYLSDGAFTHGTAL